MRDPRRLCGRGRPRTLEALFAALGLLGRVPGPGGKCAHRQSTQGRRRAEKPAPPRLEGFVIPRGCIKKAPGCPS